MLTTTSGDVNGGRKCLTTSNITIIILYTLHMHSVLHACRSKVHVLCISSAVSLGMTDSIALFSKSCIAPIEPLSQQGQAVSSFISHTCTCAWHSEM